MLLAGDTRADARALNRLARQRLADRGDLRGHGMRVRVHGRATEFRVGDVVLVTVNDYRRGLFNGTRGTVRAANDRSVTLHAGARQVTLSRESVATGMLEHGYALTCHRAQGVTVDVALVYGSRALSRESGYVGLSRGRIANHLFGTWEAMIPELDADTDGPRTPTPAAGERAELTEAALVQRLEARTAQRLASEQAAGVASRPWWQVEPPAVGRARAR